MLDQFEVCDLGLPAVPSLRGDVAVRVVVSMMRSRGVEACLVLDAAGAVLGLARWERLVAKSKENFDAPLSSMALEHVLVVDLSMPLSEAAVLVGRADLAGIAARLAGDRGYTLVTRKALAAQRDWAPLHAARARRIGLAETSAA